MLFTAIGEFSTGDGPALFRDNCLEFFSPVPKSSDPHVNSAGKSAIAKHMVAFPRGKVFPLVVRLGIISTRCTAFIRSRSVQGWSTAGILRGL